MSSNLKNLFEQLLGPLGGGAGGGAGGLLGGLFSGGAGAAAGGWLSGLFGGGADAWMAAPGILLLQQGGIIPSAAGGWVIPSFQDGGVLSKLHAGEMVLPRDISQGMQNMIRSGGGGGVTNLTVHSWDTTTASQQLMRSAQAVGKAFAASQITPRAISATGRYP